MGRFQRWAHELGYSTYLVAADEARRAARLVPASGRFWRRELELCTPGGTQRCVVDLLLAPSASELEARLLLDANGWRCTAGP